MRMKTDCASSSRGIGLWDAAASCRRKGSLDSAMRSVRCNDFSALFGQCGNLKTVLCNGKKAYSVFLRAETGRPVHTVCLPSTSAANAAMRFAEKLAVWGPYLRGEVQT